MSNKVAPCDVLWRWSAGGLPTLRDLLDAAPKAGAVGDRLQRYLNNPEIIPSEWEGKCVFFPETEFRDEAGDQRVRCLMWDGVRCGRYSPLVDCTVQAQDFVAVPAGVL